MANTKYAKPSIKTCVTISPEYYELCKKNFIQFSEALRVGISVILAERGMGEYNNKLNIVRQKEILAKKLVKYAEKYGKLDEDEA